MNSAKLLGPTIVVTPGGDMRRSSFRKLGMMLATALLTAANAWAADLPADKYTEWTTEEEVFVPMRDGEHLSTDVLLPKGAKEKLPTILIRTPYYSEKQAGGLRELWLKQGYAVVVQNERGLVLSEGHYNHYLQGATNDGYDTIDWIVKQPWSDGKVGTIGCSSSGETQWLTAAGNNPAHAAMIPAGTWALGSIPGNDTQGVFYRGGVPFTGFWAPWYSSRAQSERLLLPPNSTQAQRVRLRHSFSPVARDDFHLNNSRVLDTSKFTHLPAKDILRDAGGAMTPFDDYITYTPADARWKQAEDIVAGIKPRVPALHVSTLYDPAVVETTRLFKYLQDSETPNQYLIVGAGSHCSMFRDELVSSMSASDRTKLISAAVTPEARSDAARLLEFSLANPKFGDLEGGDARYGGEDHGYSKLFLKWFGHWLNGEQNNVTAMPKVQLYVMNEGWISGNRWPLKDTRFTKYYLGDHPASKLYPETGILSSSPPRRSGKDTYIYDPGAPTPSLGGGCCGLDVAFDQRPVEIRKDVLVYSTAPLDKPVTVAGPVEVVLYVSSSARDTDFMVKLVDVYPDGKAINLTEDAFRVRYREGFDKKVLMEAGKVYRIDLTNMVAAIRFPKGHRIGLDVSSSNFPTFDRNLNTGGNNYDETTWVVAENSVHHGAEQLSHVVLPVLPD